MVRFACTVAAAVSLALLISGCGGSSSGSGGSGPSQNIAVGHFSVGFSGPLKPSVASSSGSVVVTGMAGPITSINAIPAKLLSNTTLAFVSGGQIWTASNGVVQPITSVTGDPGSPTFSHNGQIAFTALDPVSHKRQIYTCNYDGSGLSQLTSNATDHINIAWSPNNSKIAFSDTSNLYTVTSNGATQTLVSGAGTGAMMPTWSPDSSKIAYCFPTGGTPQIFIINASGGSPVQITNQSSAVLYPSWSPDGSKIAYTLQSLPVGVYVTDAMQNGNTIQVDKSFAPDSNYQQPTFSPDSLQLSYLIEEETSGLNDLYTSTVSGANPSIVQTSGIGTSPSFPVWSPFPGPKLLVGSGGAFYPSASGFLAAENGDAFSSFVAFTSTTPANATVTAQTSGGNGALVFLISAGVLGGSDNITGLKYTNSYYGAYVNVIPTSNSAVPQALVSFSSATGQVTGMVPFAQAGSGAARSVSANGHLVFSGKFSGVWNAKGKNLAPQGASQVELDPKTGAPISWR